VSKWQCKVGTCIVAYFVKWLPIKHLRHGLVIEKAKPKRPSTFEKGPRHQKHVKMNVCILGDDMAMQRWNDQKVASYAHVKA
jgi:hypothetical protein